jgi:hypothetical protein
VARVVVIVTSEDGTFSEPAPNAREGSAADGARPYRTDAQGVHVRAHAPPGRLLVSTRGDDLFAAGAAQSVELAPGGAAEVELTLRRRAFPR